MATRDEQVRELWKLQMCLNTYVGETETELDPIILEFFPNLKPPDWFNSGIVFSPLVQAFDREIKDMQDEIYDLQQEGLELLKNRPEPQADPALDEQIIALQKDVASSESEIEEAEKKMNQPPTIAEKRLAFFDDEIKRASQVYEELSAENRKIKEMIGEWLVEVERATNEYVAGCSDLKRNDTIAKQYRKKIKEMRMEFTKTSKSGEYFEDRTRQLEQVVDRLIEVQEKNNKEIVDLQEQCGKHQELVASFNNVQILIKESSAKQESALQEMINAVDLVEQASSDVHRYHVKYEIRQEELQRLQGVIDSLPPKFDKMVTEYEASAKRYFEPHIHDIKVRIEQLEYDHAQLMKQKESMDRQREHMEQMSPDKTVGNEDLPFVIVSKFQDDVRAKFAEKVRLIKAINRSKRNIGVMETKILDVGPSKRRDAVFLRQRRQEIEMELVVLQGKLGQIVSRNAMIEEENARRKSEINRIKQKFELEATKRISEIEEKGKKLQRDIENINRENALQIQDMKGEMAKEVTRASESQNQTIQLNCQFTEARKEKRAVLRKAQKRCQALKRTIDGNDSELEKGRMLLQQTNEQVMLLKQKRDELKKKEERQKRMIHKLTSDQVGLVAENDRIQAEYDEVLRKIAAKEKEIQGLQQSSSVGDLVEMEYGVDII